MTGLLTAFALAAAFQPAGPASDLAGVWEGNVGTLPVRACFVQRDWRTFGAYYYRSRLQLIALEAADGAPGAFNEGGGGGAGPGENPPRWRIERAAAGMLTGRWTSGGRTLALRLRRVARVPGEDGACASFAFHQPRLAGVQTTSRRAAVDGTAYTKLILNTAGHFETALETFALDGTSPAVRRINTAVGAELAGNPPGWFDCISNSLSQGPYEGSEEVKREPAMISRRWLSVAEQGAYFCGGAHPDSSNVYRLFDLTSGAEVELLDWFVPVAVKREHVEGAEGDYRTLEPAFRTFLLTGWHADAGAAECDEAVRSQDSWNVGLTRDGFVFSPSLPHVAQACVEEFSVDFDRIQPWLTPQAAAYVRALRAERPGS